LAVTGLFGAPLVYLEVGALVLATILLLGGVAGAFMLVQDQRGYSMTLFLLGMLALAGALVGLMNRGSATLTLVYVVLGAVGLVRGWQTRHAEQP
jgi:hypothetical protein